MPTLRLVTPAAPGKVFTMEKIFREYFDNLGGQEWPASAEFCAKFRCRTWPIGYDRESTKVYFTSQVELDLWLFDKMRWSSLEDNGVEIHLFKWDLGPEYVRTISY